MARAKIPDAIYRTTSSCCDFEDLVMSDADAPSHQGALSIETFCRWASIGRTVAYREIAEGRLQVRKLGRRTLIPVAEAERWLNALPSPSSEGAAKISPSFPRPIRLASSS